MTSEVTAFERLHPALQYHVVNTLGWRELRPLQESAIEPIMRGADAMLLAPTAGGKTEAAVFPLLSSIGADRWRPLSVIYLAPLRALLNNLYPRLEQYASFVGARVALWHGDTSQAGRARIIADPPDILLTTPESLESMLLSRRVNERWLFPNLRTVVIDEVHSFAGGDRGWHMLALLARLERLAGRDFQRVGLSATVGNPDELLDWIVNGHDADRVVLNPEAASIADPEITLDYVGSLANAAIVISRLHRGEKRLIFVDSRRRVEELAHALRSLDVETFVSHGSLGRDERQRAEQAFSEATNCVIVATSTLELGIDVGDLDRVIQIDAPTSVAGFLQRIGRTGRRPGSSRNALLLATDDDAVLQAAGLMRLLMSGYVEDAVPPPFPVHMLGQQLLALAIQEADSGLGINTYTEWFGQPAALGDDVVARSGELVQHLLETEWLFQDGELLSIGEEAQARYGGRHFMELMSSFVSEPIYSVRHGRQEIGQVPDVALIAAFQNKPGPPALLLGGRSWAIQDIDWKRRIVSVAPSDAPAKVRYSGVGQPLGFELCQSMGAILAGESPGVSMTERFSVRLQDVCDASPYRKVATTVAEYREEDHRLRWWTFAGLRANIELAARLTLLREQVTQRSNLYIDLDHGVSVEELKSALDTETPLVELVALADWATASLKLGQILPDGWAEEIVVKRLADPAAVSYITGLPVSTVHRR